MTFIAYMLARLVNTNVPSPHIWSFDMTRIELTERIAQICIVIVLVCVMLNINSIIESFP